MPAQKRITRATPARETKKLLALAYDDAVRDILHADGRFNLADDQRRDAVWEWDGVAWRRIPLVDRPAGRAADEPPFVEVDHDDDVAALR